MINQKCGDFVYLVTEVRNQEQNMVVRLHIIKSCEGMEVQFQLFPISPLDGVTDELLVLVTLPSGKIPRHARNMELTGHHNLPGRYGIQKEHFSLGDLNNGL